MKSIQNSISIKVLIIGWLFIGLIYVIMTAIYPPKVRDLSTLDDITSGEVGLTTSEPNK